MIGPPPNQNAPFSAWLGYVERVIAAIDSGKRIPLGPSSAPPVTPASTDGGQGPRVLYCAPHPDDETLSGGLALRLGREAGATVTDVAITLGSEAGARPRRLQELRSACAVLGFGLVIPEGRSAPEARSAPEGPGATQAGGFENVNLAARARDPKGWANKVRRLAEIFDQERPEAVFAPHDDDFNSTHLGTHALAMDALDEYLSRFPEANVILIETEFWHEMSDPNLMVALTPELAAIQLTAAAEHGGEMARNPYHLLQPCRLMNNVRRGSEVVGGQGEAAQPFRFAELYRVSFRRGGESNRATGTKPPRPVRRILPPRQQATLDWIRREFSLPG